MRVFLTGAFVVLICGPWLLARDPRVYGVRASQRAGTELVDIAYGVTDSDSAWLSVSVEVSSDSGATWAVPCTSCTGDIGPGVTPGGAKAIVWDAGADWASQWSSHMQVRVRAGDPVEPPPAAEFVYLAAGSFSMGDGLAEGGPDELPAHTVTISAFHLGRFEVTKALWDEVRTWALTHGYTDLGPGQGKAGDHPVSLVDWHDVLKWCNARSERDRLTPCYTVSGEPYRSGRSDSVLCAWSSGGYRLPTEAEWEFGARGGQAGTRFPWGDTITHDNANYYSSSLRPYDLSATRGYHPAYDDGVDPRTSPQGSFPANGSGLHDTSGNVWEWCWDWYDAGAYRIAAARDPRGPTSGTARVNRGGSCSTRADSLRLADRHSDLPFARLPDLGFRLARGLEQAGGTHAAVSSRFVLETRAVVAPQGTFLADLDIAALDRGTGWWDLSGSYALTVAGKPLVMNLLHDTRGKLTGSAVYTVAKEAVVTMPIRGTVKGPAGSALASVSLRGTDPGKTAAVALRLSLTVNATVPQAEGTLVGSVTIGAVKTVVDDDVTLPIAAPMDGSWSLRLDLSQAGTAIRGGAVLTLSNGATFAYRVKGKLKDTAAVLSLAAEPADPAAKAISLKTTVLPREGGGATLQAFSGSGYGQSLAW